MIFLETIHKKRGDKIPLWLMRQAGRYLPEYRKIRKEFNNFWDLIFCPEAACEITLQPINRFDFDAAIVFSDILVVPRALGQEIMFHKGVRVIPLKMPPVFEKKEFLEAIHPICKTIKLVKTKNPEKPLIGFAGGIFSTLCYIFKEEEDKNFEGLKKIFCQRPDFFKKTQEVLEKATFEFLSAQITAGADVVQLFESWGSLCPWTHADLWLIEPTSRLVSSLKKKHPNIPIIFFSKGCGHLLEHYSKLPIDVFSLDYATSFDFFKGEQVLQGNLDPALLLCGGIEMELSIRKILRKNYKNPFIFNLGHGILKDTPIANVEKLVSMVRLDLG